LTPLSQKLSDSPTVNVATRQIFSTQQGSQTRVPTGQPKQGTHATGILTFENSTFSWVTIPAGTSVTSGTGEEIVTNMTLDIPPDPGTPGIASVPSHAIKIGRSGNIQAMSINQACCFVGILVLNKSAFSGGIDSQATPTVQQSDIDNIANPLETSLTQKALSGMQSYLTSDTHLLSSTFQCSPKITSTPKIGESATNFTVDVLLTCSESVYSLQTVPLQAEVWLKQKAAQQLGPSFIPVGTIETSIKRVTEDKNGNVDVLISAKGTWNYRFTAASKLEMVKYIARKTKNDAQSWLLRQTGIVGVSVSITGPIFIWRKNDTLPDDSGAITLNV